MPGESEPATAVLTQFLASFAAADGAAAARLFWPDALFWGTAAPDLATEAEQVRAYFSSFAQWRPNQRRAEWISGTTLPLSDSAVMISGRWQIVSGEILRPLRVSMLVTRRGEAWRIAQFHNSPRPEAA
ncbi:nuclear transport factor 2 family protein [Sediminicoccus sp. KRV36]|uniref:nuclear transport factor 2 family protein n=1 Tax=Sediminicoccus sp. KRV36 TaxID=3133721 RepID=UPI0020103BC5|nr:nuclear transport factor 2 family protein [Sediminicoccus rosea]UPY35176.1 nuclear transport factor 2 family protein [Sediminicoccus rosea]